MEGSLEPPPAEPPPTLVQAESIRIKGAFDAAGLQAASSATNLWAALEPTRGITVIREGAATVRSTIPRVSGGHGT